MSEPTWELLGGGGVIGGPIDYVGAWAAGTQYQPGQVVRYGGIDYLAVNPSLGQTPPLGSPLSVGVVTALPASPADGMEAVLVDSLTAPTYAWRFRYVASITDAYKWLFVGGAPLYLYIVTGYVISTLNVFQTPVPGPDLIVPRTGNYLCRFGSRITPQGGISEVGVANASIGLSPIGGSYNASGASYQHADGEVRLPGLIIGQTLRLTVWANTAVTTFADRYLSLIPQRVS